MKEYLKEIKKERESIENEYKELGKEIPEPKFKTGDVVIIVDDWFTDLFNAIGTVTWDIQLRRTLDNDSGITYLYYLLINGHNGRIGVQEESIMLVE